MSTDIRKTLQELAKMQPAEGYVLSVYVNAMPDGRGRRNYNVFLKKKLNEIGKTFKPHSPEAEAFPKDVKEITRYLEEDLRPESKGAAIFISQKKKLFKTFQTALPLVNRVILSRVPFIYPLARISDDYDRYGVLISDEKQAKLLKIYLGHIEEEADIITAADDISAKGYETRKGRLGLSDEKHRRHLKELMAKHIKSAIKEAQRFFNGDMTHLLVAAENGTLAEISRQLPAGLKGKVITTSKFDVKSPVKKVLEESLKMFKTLENQGSQRIANETVVLAKSKGGRAMLGTNAVISALQDGRAESLVLSEKFSGQGWQCLDCLKLGVLGRPKQCPYCGSSDIDKNPDMKEEVVGLALRRGLKVEFVEGAAELDKNSGIGALMRSK
jgi:peptide subunit release factor 1 (eRF1)